MDGISTDTPLSALRCPASAACIVILAADLRAPQAEGGTDDGLAGRPSDGTGAGTPGNPAATARLDG